MRHNWWRTVALCAALALIAGCAAEHGVTSSGSDQWSRGVILDTTPAEVVAVAAWGEETVVVWPDESGQLRLARLDAALTVTDITDLALQAFYPNDMRLQLDEAGGLHLTWEDRLGGVPALIYARVVPGVAQPAAQTDIRLPTEARHIDRLLRPESGRVDVFWSDLSGRDSGVAHQAFSLAGDTLSEATRLTEQGWQPGAAWGSSRTMYVAWVTRGRNAALADVWQAEFDPETLALASPTWVAEARDEPGYVFYGPGVGPVGAQAVVVWGTGQRRVQMGIGDVPGDGMVERLYRFSWEYNRPAGSVHGDDARYALVSPTSGSVSPAISLSGADVVEAFNPAVRVLRGQTWAVFGAWVPVRSSFRLQIAVAPFDQSGRGDAVLVTDTWQTSLWPDLAAAEDDTLRAAWLETLGDDYRVVVASTAAAARQALGGFRVQEWLEQAAVLGADALSMLFLAPLVVAWVALPTGLIMVVTFINPDRVRGRTAILWLGLAVVLQLVCKQLIAPTWMPVGFGTGGIVLTVVPLALGLLLMLVYWRRAEEPSLLSAYALFALTDALFSLFVALPFVLRIR